MKLRFGPYLVETSNDDKLLFPDSGISKADVIRYYRSVAELMRPHLSGRCLTMRRFPDGLGANGFFQQHRAGHFPDYVGAKALPTADGSDTVQHVVVDNTAALIYLADQAALEFHGWQSRAERPRRPDRIVFDLDPSGDDFRPVIDCARLLRKLLEAEAGLVAYVMTSGSRGLHVLAPLSATMDFAEVRDFAADVAAAAARHDPERFAVEQRKAARRGRLYIDVGRNAYGQTAVLPYSLRAIEGAPVATPLAWDELGRSDLSPRRYRLGNIGRRLARKEDPFSGFFRHRRKPSVESSCFGDGEETN